MLRSAGPVSEQEEHMIEWLSALFTFAGGTAEKVESRRQYTSRNWIQHTPQACFASPVQRLTPCVKRRVMTCKE